MIQIRSNVFETNSSSTHSVSVSSLNSHYSSSTCLDEFIEYYENKVHVSFGEFGWEYEHYDLPYSKLSYILTMLAETEGRNIQTVAELFETDGFKLINDAVADYCNCDGIWIDSDMKMACYEWDGNTHIYFAHDGYIDHQSCKSYGSVQDFLDDYDLDITEFLFDDGVCVITDNDNH